MKKVAPTESPLVSICMPTYNGGVYLQASVESALAQTEQNFELLLVDDGSTDNTLALASGYAERDARVRVVSNPHNLGLVGNWNECLRLARGQWIKFLFQDDTLEPTFLSRTLRLAEQHPHVQFVVANRTYLFEDDADPALRRALTHKLPFLHDLWPSRDVVEGRDLLEAALQQFPPLNIIGEPSCVLFRRELIDEVGAFDPSFINVCDLEMWLRLSTVSPVGYVEESLSTFRVHGASETARNHDRSLRLRLDLVLLWHKLLADPVFAAVRQQLDPILVRAAHRRLGQAAYRLRREARSSGQSDVWSQLVRPRPLLTRLSWWYAMRRFAGRTGEILGLAPQPSASRP